MPANMVKYISMIFPKGRKTIFAFRFSKMKVRIKKRKDFAMRFAMGFGLGLVFAGAILLLFLAMT